MDPAAQVLRVGGDPPAHDLLAGGEHGLGPDPATHPEVAQDPSVLVGAPCRSRTVNGTGRQVRPPSVLCSSTSGSVCSTSTRVRKPSRAPQPVTVTGRSRVAVVALLTPVNQASRPLAGRTGIASSSPCAQSRRAAFTEPAVRVGWTRLVSRIANDREAKSITIEVPVKPV